MKRLPTTILCAVVLSLAGCSMHCHGEAGSGSGSSKSSGDERTAHHKPKPHQKPHHNTDDTSSGQAAAPKPAAPKPVAQNPAPEPTKPSTAGGSVAGQIATRPLPPVNVNPSNVPSGAAASGNKPGSGGGVGGTGAAGAIATGGGSGNKPALGGGAAGAIATGSGSDNKPVKPPVGTGGGRSAASAAADKLAAAAAAARGAGRLPSGKTPNGEEKPADEPINKPEETGAQPSGAFAMIPAAGQNGKGSLRVPVPITGISCKLQQTEIKMGAKFKVRGEGFSPAAKVTVGGIEVPVSRNKPTQLYVQLPRELANGGDVVLTQGDVVARCGNLTISAK